MDGENTLSKLIEYLLIFLPDVADSIIKLSKMGQFRRNSDRLKIKLVQWE